MKLVPRMRVLPDADPGDPGERTPWGYLLWVANRQKRSLAAAATFDILWLLGLALTPWAIGNAIDEGILAGDRERLLLWVGVLLALALLEAAVQALRDRAGVNNWMQAAYRSMQLLCHHVTRTGRALTAEKSTGEVASVGWDTLGLANIYFMTSGLISSLVAYAVVAVIVLQVSISVGLFVLLGVPAFSALFFVLVRPLRARQAAQREAAGQMTALGADTVAGLRVLRGIGGEHTFVERYREKSQLTRRAGVDVAGPVALIEALQVLTSGILVVGLTWLGAVQAQKGAIEPGQLVALYGYAGFLVIPIQLLSGALSTLTRSLVGSQRLLSVLAVGRAEGDEHPLASTAPAGPSTLLDPESGVRVDPGLVTAITGADPAQVSEIADRLARLDGSDPAGSPAMWGDVPLTKLPLEDVRSRITLADAEPQLFTGSLRSELDPHGEHVDEEIVRALRAASGADILESLPDGLDTPVQERGRSFSGGQRQRLGLARALLTDAEVLVLVDPASAVDAHTEARIGTRVPEYRRSGRTGNATVVVTTSPLLLGAADVVFHVVDGVAVAAGSHHALLGSHPAYRATVLRDDVA